MVNTVEHLYDYQLQRAGLSVLDSVTSTIHQRLHIFRTHHHKCAARRQNALGYELRQESQKTQWLKRKYLDSVRQQQQHQGISERCKMDSVTTAGNRGANSNREVEVVATESSLVGVSVWCGVVSSGVNCLYSWRRHYTLNMIRGGGGEICTYACMIMEFRLSYYTLHLHTLHLHTCNTCVNTLLTYIHNYMHIHTYTHTPTYNVIVVYMQDGLH